MKANEPGWTLAKQQQVKQEKQARGTWGVQPSVPARSGSTPGMNLGGGHAAPQSDQELGGLFTGLLLGQPGSQDTQPSGLPRLEQVDDGTNPVNLILKKQEDTTQKTNTSEAATQFELDVDGVGRVLVSALTEAGRLQISLQFPNQVPQSGREMLTRLLNIRLSQTVGLPVEVKIGN